MTNMHDDSLLDHNMEVESDSSTGTRGVINGFSEQFVSNSLNDDQKNEVIASHNKIQQKNKDSGLIGRLIGANTKNAAVNIASVICVCIFFLLLIDLLGAELCRDGCVNLEMWKILAPIITMTLGYIFGKGSFCK